MDKIVLWLLFSIVLALIGVVGDFFIKLSGNGTKFIELKWFIIGFVIYAMTAFGWFYLMKNVKLATLGVFYSISTVLFVTILGVFYFKESINFYEIVGIVAAIISLILLGKFA
jgi:drug/metabolite transporter (DMT)-like permease